MTRIHQALERAKAFGTATPTTAQPPLRAPHFGQPAAAVDRPLTVVKGEWIRCPHCGAQAHRLSSRAWLQSLLVRMGLPPYRCGTCRSRFSQIHFEAPVRTGAEAFSTFIRPEGEGGFQQLLEQIAEAERSQKESGASPAPRQDPREGGAR